MTVYINGCLYKPEFILKIMKDLDRLQKLLQTLGDINRLRILHHINKNECAVSEIVEATELSQPLVSHHLRTLKENGILETSRKGPFIYYKLKSPELLDVLGILSEMSQYVTTLKPEKQMFHCPSWWRKMHHTKTKQEK